MKSLDRRPVRDGSVLGGLAFDIGSVRTTCSSGLKKGEKVRKTCRKEVRELDGGVVCSHAVRGRLKYSYSSPLCVDFIAPVHRAAGGLWHRQTYKLADWPPSGERFREHRVVCTAAANCNWTSCLRSPSCTIVRACAGNYDRICSAGPTVPPFHLRCCRPNG